MTKSSTDKPDVVEVVEEVFAVSSSLLELQALMATQDAAKIIAQRIAMIRVRIVEDFIFFSFLAKCLPKIL